VLSNCDLYCCGHWSLYVMLVPQVLALMVDLEDDPEWSVSEEIDEDDNDRLPLAS